MKVRRIFLSLNCLFEFFAGITGATFVLFLYSKGLNPIEANFVVAMSLIVSFFMEIPTGALADSIGYEKTTILSGILLTVTNMLFFFGETIAVFLVAQVSLGIACALESGTLDAWVIDNTSVKESETVFIKKNQVVSVMMILTGFLGGIVSDIYIEGIFLFSFVASLLYIGIAVLVMPKVEGSGRKQEKRKISNMVSGVRTIIKESVNYCVRDRTIWNIILFNSILAFAFSPVFVFWSPVLYSFEQANYTFIGFAWVLMRGAMLVGNAILEKRKERSFFALAAVSIGCGASVMLLSFLSEFWLLLFGILVFECFLGIIYPLKETVLNMEISHENRATILSFNSMIVSIFNYVSMLVMGKIATVFSIQITWKISGVLLIVGGMTVCIGKLFKRKEA